MRRPASEKGFVLVCVMWILALLTVVAISFSRRAMLEHRAAAYAIDRTQVLYMARGAVTRGVVEVSNKAAVDRFQGRGGRTSFDQRWANPPDMFNEESYYEMGSEEEKEDEECKYIIEDAERYISINTAPTEVLEEIPGMSLRIVNQISRRRDDSSDEQRSMAFLTIEEVRTLDGMSDEAWYGTEDEPGLKDLITVYGDGKINLNTCSWDVLRMIPELTDDERERLRSYLKIPLERPEHKVRPRGVEAPEEEEGAEGDGGTGGEDVAGHEPGGAGSDAGGNSGRKILTGWEELAQADILEPAEISILQRYCKLDSSFFTITGFATQRQGKIRATVIATVQALSENTPILSWREEAFGL